MTTHPAIATFAEFARILGVSRGWVTQLKKDGRLVLTPDGKLVQVAESIARIEATRDPAKDAVAARHAAGRAGRWEQGAPAPLLPAPPVEAPAPPAAPAPADDPADDEPAEAAKPTSSEFVYWREREQKAKALAAERVNAIAEGKLIDAEDAKAATAQAFSLVRNTMEQLPDTLGPQLLGMTDESRHRALMVEAIEIALGECARKLNDLAKEPDR